MENNYIKLLDRVWDNLPEELQNAPRFEMPRAHTFVEGNQTIIKNFNEIARRLERDPEEILKYLSKELAAPSLLQGNRAVIQRVLRAKIIDEKIVKYSKEYILCHECGRPDTKISELKGQKIIKCGACGAWWPFRRIK